MNLNKVLLIGRITTDLNLKQTKKGRNVLTFGLATNKVWSDEEGRKRKVFFHQVVAWGRNAELISTFCKKGDLIFIEGELQSRDFVKDDIKKKQVEVIVKSFQFGPSVKKQLDNK